jgi:hypothetical protein
MANRRIEDLLSNYLVLKSAWERVKYWYSLGEFTPQPEFTHWLLHPDEKLSSLGEKLASNSYTPDPFTLIPYPKKGAMIRHYSMPTVKDQVAFCVFGILLAPYLESSMLNFSFGNRWYRKTYRDRSGDEPKWKERPFSLSDKSLYQPYRRAHGLFRRVSHWSALSMFNPSQERDQAGVKSIRQEDYPVNKLPPFVKPDWWTTDGAEKGYWVDLDIEMAYPSVRLELLEKRMLSLLSEDPNRKSDLAAFGFENDKESCLDYPLEIQKALQNVEIRKELVTRLTNHLKSIKYEKNDIKDLWKPPHSTQRLPDEEGHIGIPTGLSIAGFLINAYLTGFDYKMAFWLLDTKSENKERAAFFRFVDDIVLIANSHSFLMSGIDEIWRNLIREDNDSEEVRFLAKFPTPGVGSNLRLNIDKIEPDPIKEIVSKYLIAYGWKECDDCKKIYPDPKKRFSKNKNPKALADWISDLSKKNNKEAIEIHSKIKKLEMKALKKEEVYPFVTRLVERMSEIADDTLLDRFGSGTISRLKELHDLVQLNIDDIQVKQESRLSFAAMRLAKAWLPEEDPSQDSALLAEIRQSLRSAILQVPWKFKIWKAAIRAGARQAIAIERRKNKNTYDGIDWLKEIVGFIGIDGKWMKEWPEEQTYHEHCYHSANNKNKLKKTKSLYLSFLRASFWRYLAVTINEIGDYVDEMEYFARNREVRENPYLSSNRWLFRAFEEKSARQVLHQISDLEVWAQSMYNSRKSIKFSEITSLEVSSLQKAVLAAVGGEKILLLIKKVKDRENIKFKTADQLRLPDEITLFKNMGLIKSILQIKEGLIRGKAQNIYDIPTWTLLARKKRAVNHKIASIVAEEYSEDIDLLLNYATALGLTEYLPLKLLDQCLKEISKKIEEIRTNQQDSRYILLKKYERLRRFCLICGKNTTKSNEEIFNQKPTIHRLLWGDWWTHQDLRSMQVKIGEAPSLGVPIRVASKLLLEGLTKPKNTSEMPFPIWIISEGSQAVMSHGRRHQLGFRDEKAPQGKVSELIRLGGLKDWEIYPHPSYFFIIDTKHGNRELKEVWHNVLLFLSAAIGSEKILDQIFINGPGVIPFEERYEWREDIPIPKELWKTIEKVIRKGMGYKPIKHLSPQELKNELISGLEYVEHAKISINDFSWEQIDTILEINNDLEVPIEIKPFYEKRIDQNNAGKAFKINETNLFEKLCVRIGQINAHPNWEHVVRSFPNLPRREIQTIMRQIWAVVLGDHMERETNGMNTYVNLVVLPEVALPPLELRSVRELTERTNKAVLTGMYWKLVPTAASQHFQTTLSQRYFTNEAAFCIPLFIPGDQIWPLVRTFRIRKPIPSNRELGLARALSTEETIWRIVPGQKWYRFLHPEWGDFTIAICSDITDPSPWHQMRGDILHIFICSYNEDADLFEAMTWVRAYENYANIVSANNGEYGGSFAWSPKHGHQKEIARLRGKNLFLDADIIIPVRELFQKQRSELENSVEKARNYWLNRPLGRASEYKAPPPNFPMHRRR